MKAERIVEHIDKKVITRLSDGLALEKAAEYLISEYCKFAVKEDFIKGCTLTSVIDTWEEIPVKKRYYTFYALQALNRANNINWIIENKSNLPKVRDINLYRLIKFREKIIQGEG